MADLENVLVSVFDPATPFKKVVVESVGIDSWYRPLIITKELKQKIPYVPEIGRGDLPLSSGMSVKLPVVKIGIQIGSIHLPEIEALVVDSGANDLLLGSHVFNEAFKAGREREAESSSAPSSAGRDDKDALSLELYPLAYPFNSAHLENVIRNQRVLHNILLISLDKVSVRNLPPEHLDAVIYDEVGIPDSLRLKISAISEGSIWLSLKSGSQSTLKYLASFFQKGATAKLAQEIAEANRLEAEVEISKKTRDAVVLEIIAEKEKLRAESIHQTYETFRKEFTAQLNFMDDLIQQTSDGVIAEELRKRKNQAILALADQQMVPIVRNVPGSYSSLEWTGRTALPPPSDQ